MFYRKDPKEQQKEIDRKPTDQEIRYGTNPTCFGVHERLCVSCDETSCRNWIDFEEDLNCAIICARKNENGLPLRDVADRMGVTYVRVHQIEGTAMTKVKKRNLFDFEQCFAIYETTY